MRYLTVTSAQLHPGDVLLYGPKGVYGWLIKFHTGSPDVAHVELYLGNSQSLASRDKIGVDLYPWRNTELTHVLRPRVPFDAAATLAWYERDGKGVPYGWFDLLQFCGYNVNGKGMVCSPCVAYGLRAGHVPIFGSLPAERITPRDFLLVPEVLADLSAILSAPPTAEAA